MNEHYLTAGDLALYEQNRRGYGYGYDGHCYQKRNSLQGASITGVVLGGAALFGVIAAAWGVNAASKARSRGSERAIDILANQAVVERQSRENWQAQHAPTLTQYVDVQTGAGAYSGSNANAAATALALQQNSGINSAIGGCNFLRVARYSAPKPCDCDSCNG
ncbi:MAG: hypothetical protein J6C45_07630 [Alistipes sp.]|nr:hypothetical protein [Alistipes sp.]